MPTAATIRGFSAGKLDLDTATNVFLMDKVEVNGAGALDVFGFLKNNSELGDNPITWNFGKFLVDGRGGVFKYYDPKTRPNNAKPDIETLMAAAPPPC